jgi:hypothetical protein
MPFDNSLEWLRTLIVQAGDSVDVHVERADDIFRAGIVIEQIKERIRAADVILAVCTGQNPNVFFELGIADQWHWPIILAEEANDLPFDIRHYRAIIYGGPGRAMLSKAVEAAIEETLRSGRKDREGVAVTEHPPQPEPRVLGQFMMQVHAWGLDREGSLEHFPVDLLFLVQDVASTTREGRRALAEDFPRRDGVMANRWEVTAAAEDAGLIQRNYDPDSSEWYLVVTEKGEGLIRAYDRFMRNMASQRP